jgi:gamma-glutamylcyclotransferase (GGCT)/AIG2-like uncharacterized protein YtfP
METGLRDGATDVLAFVYGTLRRNGSNHFRMEGSEFLDEAAVCGRLYRIDWFPGVVLDDTAGGVSGELYRVDDATLAALDAYEGPEYRRLWADVTPRGGSVSVTAWVWEWILPTDESARIPSGDWMG